MKIVQISTYDVRGGAAIAANRLHKGLRQIGQDCQMLVKHKNSNENSVHSVVSSVGDEKSDDKFFLDVAIQEHYINSQRTDISNTIFSLPYPGYDLSNLPLVREADILNLHWVAQYQSPLTIQRLAALNKPMVWTLHDQWAFTGGCHYGAGCRKYEKNCVRCPQLGHDEFELTAAVLKDKAEVLKNVNLTIVTPSRWMATCSMASRLFKGFRTEVIPNSLETDVFRPVPKKKAKHHIGLDPDVITLLFGSEDGNEKRKGFKKLIAGIRHCLVDSRFQSLVADNKIRLICFGHRNHEIESLGIPVMPLGYLDADEKISAAYNSADIFMLPSLEDNLPNTVLEAMGCGTPVVAFDVGGVSDMVENGVMGQLVPLGDTEQMGQAILSLIFDKDKRDAMRKECCLRIEGEYALHIQAQRYLELYEELFNKDKSFIKNTEPISVLKEMVQSKPIDSEAFIVPVDLEVGPYFDSIYEKVLFAALKGYAPFAKKQWQESEADRTARLDQVKGLKRLLEESEADRSARLRDVKGLWAQVKELDVDQRLKEVEEDNQARLDQIIELTRLIKESEIDRKARYDQISELTRLLTESEADREARLVQINELARLLKKGETDKMSLEENLSELRNELQELGNELAQQTQRVETLGKSFVVRVTRKLGFVKDDPVKLPETSKSGEEQDPQSER